MLQKEFFELTNIELTTEEFEAVHAMYNSCGNLDKREFCADYKEHKGSVILNQFYEQYCRNEEKVKELQIQVNNLKVQISNLGRSMIDAAESTKSTGQRDAAIQLMGFKTYLMHKFACGYNLWDEDKYDIIGLIK